MNRHQRRTIAKLTRTGRVPVELQPTFRLSERAFEIVTADLAAFGSRPDEKHREALMRIVGMFSRMAQGEVRGRYAFPLPTGAGKTQSVIAWCAAVHELGTGHSVVVAASKVEDLCDIHRKLMGKGVPADTIGLLHSKRYDPTKADEWNRRRDPKALADDKGQQRFASLPATLDNDSRQFLLVTHARVQSRRADSIELLNTYRGKPRNLCIWDESLIVSQSRGMSKMELDSATGWFRPRALDAAAKATIDYIDECRDILSRELAGQKDGRQPQTARLPERSEGELDAMVRTLGTSPITKPLRDFLGLSQGDLRVVVAVNQGGGAFVTYDIVVPAELRTVAILDASYAIRELEQMDSSIHRDPGFDGAVKLYDTVTINHLRAGSGRSAMERSFSERAREDRKVSAEVCAVVATIPNDAGVILFTFKPGDSYRSPDITEILRRDLSAGGIDIHAMLPPDEEGRMKPRLRWLSWGMETSISDHKDCPNVIFAGVLHRSEADLAGSIIGQRDDILTDLPAGEVADIQRSEIAHSLYQAMSRGSCRDTIDGHAKPMTAWLIHHDSKVRDILDKVMPGVAWQDWQPQYLDATEAKADDLVVTIAGYLRGLDPNTTRVSTRAVKDALGVRDQASKRTFSRAVRKFIEGEPGWTIEGLSLVRSTEGFVPEVIPEVTATAA